MEVLDEAAVVIAAAVLRGSDREIEALTLEALASEADLTGIDQALAEAARSEKRGGAFGMEIVGAILIPVLIEAARQFWQSYSKNLVDKLGSSAAEATLARFRGWFLNAPANEQREAADRLAIAIRTEGAKRGLAEIDIDALIAATAPEKLSTALAAE